MSAPRSLEWNQIVAATLEQRRRMTRGWPVAMGALSVVFALFASYAPSSVSTGAAVACGALFLALARDAWRNVHDDPLVLSGVVDSTGTMQVREAWQVDVKGNTRARADLLMPRETSLAAGEVTVVCLPHALLPVVRIFPLPRGEGQG